MFEALDGMTATKLKKLCQEDHITGYGKLKKKQLVQHVKIHKINGIIKNGMDQLLAL